MDDIALAAEWTPIGDHLMGTFFSGKYDGNNKTISDILISNGGQYFALFSCIKSGSISNLTLRNVDITGKNYCAPLCSFAFDSVIENIKIEGDINISSTLGSWSYLSGLVCQTVNSSGKNTFRNIHITGNLNIGKNDPFISSGVGGLIALDSGSDISECCIDSPNGLIKGDSTVGGLIGVITGDTRITNSYSRINIKGNVQVGGLIGVTSYPTVSIDNSYADCQISLASEDNNLTNCGGLIGVTAINSVSVSNCYASGTIYLGNSNGKFIGTLIGTNWCSPNKSFSTVKISVGELYTYDGDSYNYNPNAAGTPLWIKNSAYVYDSDGTNYFGTGYTTTLEWSSAHWFNLTEGGFPKLIGLPNR